MERTCFYVNNPGSLRNLEKRKELLGFPATQEVTVSVKSIGLNYADVFTVMGLYKAAPKSNFIPGLEFSGEISAIGDDVSTWKIGDRVYGVTKFGAFANHINIHQDYISQLPDSWSYQEGAAYPVQALTAYYALLPLGNLQKGHAVLIHSAAGGVGLLANRIAKKYDAYTIGVVGSEEKVPFALKEGYNAVVVRNSGFKEQIIKALDGRELNLVLETAGGKYLKWSYELLAPQGRLVTYGSAGFTPSGDRPNYIKLVLHYLKRPKIDPHAMITENKSVMAFNLIWLYERTALMQQILQELNQLELPPPFIGHTYKFDELPEALSFFRTGKNLGKIIVDL